MSFSHFSPAVLHSCVTHCHPIYTLFLNSTHATFIQITHILCLQCVWYRITHSMEISDITHKITNQVLNRVYNQLYECAEFLNALNTQSCQTFKYNWVWMPSECLQYGVNKNTIHLTKILKYSDNRNLYIIMQQKNLKLYISKMYFQSECKADACFHNRSFCIKSYMTNKHKQQNHFFHGVQLFTPYIQKIHAHHQRLQHYKV